MDGPGTLSAGARSGDRAANAVDSPTVRRHVLLVPSIARNAVWDAAETLARDALRLAHRPDASLRIVNAFPIGRSVLLEGDAETLTLLAGLPQVQSVFEPQPDEDALPRPVARRPA